MVEKEKIISILEDVNYNVSNPDGNDSNDNINMEQNAIKNTSFHLEVYVDDDRNDSAIEPTQNMVDGKLLHLLLLLF